MLALTLPLTTDASASQNSDKKGSEGDDEGVDGMATATGWKGHEAFYIVAPDVQMLDSAEGIVDGMKLREEWWPGTKVREGWWDGALDTSKNSGRGAEWLGAGARRVEPRRRGFYNCKKAERMLGWVHAASE